MTFKFERYIRLRKKADALTHKLEELHSQHLSCKMGCDLCCMDYSIFPVEFYYMLEVLKKKKPLFDFPSVTKSELCVFLKDHKCTIYTERPIICRTHGLPLLFMNDDSNWELSACELNFTKFDFTNFTNDNTFPQDSINSELFMANMAFIQEFDKKQYADFDLIPIKELLNELKKN